MSIKVTYNRQLISFLNSIFYESPNETDEFLPIIKDARNIPNIIPFINIFQDAEMNLDNAVSLIFFLKNLFLENNDLIPVFIKLCTKNKITFLESLVNLYLQEKLPNESLIMIEDLINDINYNVSICKNIFEYIYQKLNIYFNIKQTVNKNNNKILTESVLLRYLKLLNIFYTDIKKENELTEQQKSNNEDKIIRNFFYFNGQNSGITLSLNKTSNNLSIDSPTLIDGCTVIFYVNLDKEILDKYFQAFFSADNENIILVQLIFHTHIISLELKNSHHISILVDEVESEPIDISKVFKYNMWNCIMLLIEPKSKKKGIIKVAINETIFTSSVCITKNFDFNEKIDNIILFDHLIGKVTSIIFFSYLIENNKLLHFFNTTYGGFYKNKILSRFLYSIDKDYFKNIKNFKENEKFKADKNMAKIYNLSIGIKDINKNKIISIICPFMYNQNTNIIDDVFGTFIGKLNSNFDGVNIYNKNIKNIAKLGGINNLLPISELMLNSLKKDNKYFVDKNILTEATLLEYLTIIKHILSCHKASIIELNNNYFFSSLCLFLEKYPSKIFTEKIINIFLEICKETFKYKESQLINSKVDLENISNNYKFVSIIIFNKKIISKFSFENQLKIWEGIYNLFKIDNNLIKDALDFPKIINLLRFYDQNRYEKFCCKKHASLFGCKNEDEIIQPELNARIGKLYDIIQIFIDKADAEKQEINLYKILCLDLSSCLKKKVIQIYMLHFINDKISNITKEKTLNNLLKNNYFEITEYTLSISLLDVRIEMFKLLHIIELKYKDKFIEYLKKTSLNLNQIMSYISKKIIPIDLKIKQLDETNETVQLDKQTRNRSATNYYINVIYRENLFGKCEDKNNLFNYFSRKIYETDISALWGLLNSWMTQNTSIMAKPQPSNTNNNLSKSVNMFKKDKNENENIIKEEKNNLLINPFVLNFCVEFVCCVKPFYIDSFLNFINSYVTSKIIQNKEIIFQDKFFYWLVDTIFFFHNKENENMVEEKFLINSIQKNSLELLCQIFKIKASLKEIENKLYYIMEYSFYFKNKLNKSNNNYVKELIRITRLIFEELLKSSDLYFNIKSIFCFEFIFLYRNNEDVLTNYIPSAKRNSLLDSDNLNKFLKKTKVELGIRKKSLPRTIHIDEYEKILKAERRTIVKNPFITENYETSNTIMNEINFIPNYYYQGMFSNHQTHSQNNNNQNKKILKNVWMDYEIYSYILDYYRNNVWGPETLFKQVKLVYDPEKNIFDSCQVLLNMYGDNKDFRNVLLKNIIKLTIIDYDFQNAINKINVLYLNLILLCFSLDIAGVLSEQEEITQKIVEFLIFCILVSININQTEDTYNYIQKKLYDTLSFGFLFLKDKDEQKYRELMFFLIEPFFEEILHKKIFGSKKSLYKNSAIYKVFVKLEADNLERKSIMMESIPKKGMSTSMPKKKATYVKDLKSNTIKSKLGAKKKNKLLLFIRGNPNQISKDLFTKVINFYKEKKFLFNRDDNILLFYFKYENNIKDNNKKNNYEYFYELEKKRINLFMKKLIPDLLSEIKKSSISSYLEEKKRRNVFKKIKKQLFSWNGFWCDKTLFLSHPEYLKFKIKNHFCHDMSKILLSPILDLKYYLPNFSKFDITNLFNKNDYKYHICMDVDEILKISDKKEEENTNDRKIIKYINQNFNYLESLYKSQYNNLWDIYYTHLIEEYNENENTDINNLSSKEVFELLFQKKLNSINEDNVKSENLYNCCIVKPTHHIKGYITTEKRSITFTYCPDNESKELLEKDPSYDKDMGACFGSTFKMHYKDKDKICFEIKYNSIEYMFKRNYFYQETGLEIFTYEKKSYFLNFKSNQELLKFINDIIQHEKFRTIKCHQNKGKKLIGYCKLFNVYTKKTSHYVNNKMEEWQNNIISTFEYIMWLNIFAGRSFNDLTQYPVFPWIITNYQTDKLNEKEDFRNLSIPVGMFDYNEKAEMRKETFIEFYNTLKNEIKESKPDFDYEEYLEKNEAYLEHYNNKKLKNNENSELNAEKMEINQLPYFYGTHYSNPTYVSHYLTRLFPHASISIEIHGDKFEDPNRMFFSMNRTFETASTLKDDIRELIPEFYILPEIFLNNNNFNLSQNKLDSEGKEMVINDVELPPWSNNTCTNFIVEMRKNLEKNNLKINKWIDLIFGNLQKGKKAEENNNIFMSNTYENMVKIENIKDDDEKNALMRLVEVGVTPIQLYASESKQRNDISQIITKPPYSNSKGAFLWESTELKCFSITMHKFQKIIQKFKSDYKPNKDNGTLILPLITKMKAIHKNELRIFTNCNYLFNLKFVKNENKYVIEESSLVELYNISSKYAPSYQMSNIKLPVIVFGNNKFMIKGGFWDGRIEINIIISDSKEEKDKDTYYSINEEEGPVTILEINKDENLLLCGTLYGCIIAYQIEYLNNNANIQLHLINKIFDHNNTINSISINDHLNMFATSGNDEYVYLYLLPTFEIFRSIKISEKHSHNNYEDELLIANNVFLSNSPLPCISIFIKSQKLFRTYTINGKYIAENQETDNSNEIKCYIIFNDFKFCDYIIYGTDDGMIKIRSFPDMNLINYYKPFDYCETLCLELSFDKRYCYAWSKGGEIAVIKDVSVNDPTEVDYKKTKFK